MSKETSLETRMCILELSQANNTDQRIAHRIGYSIHTVRKWRRRGQHEGRGGLVSQMGRPRRGALSSFPEALRKDTRFRRIHHPGWGPDTLVGEIKEDGHWQGKRQPSRSSIARFLKEQGLTRSYERRTQVPQEKRKSPFPTRMHLWLTALGIDLTFSRRNRPTDQGAVERSHQLWAAQVLQGQSYSSWEALYFASHNRRDFLNGSLPCASLDGLPPLLAFPQAAHSGRHYRPEWEVDLLEIDRVFDYLQQGHWFRKVSTNGTLGLGRNVMSVAVELARQQLEVKVHPAEPVFLCYDAHGDLVASCQPTNLTKEYLMGHSGTAFNLPFFQLALPFDEEAKQVIRLFRTLSVTI